MPFQKTHGLRKNPMYGLWSGMIQRCGNANDPAYPNYGGRGISVCDRWRKSFVAFFDDMGERPDGLTLDRIDNDKGYEPENCQWADRSQQSVNRRCTRILSYDGREMNMVAWSKELGIKRRTIGERLRRGWSVDDALGTPTQRHPRWH